MTRRTIQFIRWGVFIAACSFLGVRLIGHQSMHAIWAEWRSGTDRLPWAAVGALCALMVLNWGIEAWKWQWLMRPVERVAFGKAFTATIAGTSIGLITPNRVGEFAGRVLFLAPEHRVRGGFATALGSIAQFVVTLFVGSLALPFLPFLRRYKADARVLEEFHRRELLRVLALSVLRYLVFTFQFALVLNLIANVPYSTAFLHVPVVFLFTTLLPTVMLTELGVRGSVSAALIPGLDTLILLSTFLVWVINLALPALAGSIILLFARIRSAQDPG